MSSHHFVREGQEPALLILNAIPFEIAGPLLEWVPLILVDEPALEDVLTWGIKVDVVLSVNGSKPPVLESLKPVEWVPYAPGTCLQTALQYLKTHNHLAVTILTNNAEACFETDVPFSSFPVNVVDETHRWILAHSRFEKWLPTQTVLQLIKTQEVQLIETSGVATIGEAWISQGDGLVSLRSNHPFWVGEIL